MSSAVEHERFILTAHKLGNGMLYLNKYNNKPSFHLSGGHS